MALNVLLLYVHGHHHYHQKMYYHHKINVSEIIYTTFSIYNQLLLWRDGNKK